MIFASLKRCCIELRAAGGGALRGVISWRVFRTESVAHSFTEYFILLCFNFVSAWCSERFATSNEVNLFVYLFFFCREVV